MFRVSKEYFDEVRDKIMGKLKDTNNHGEELESRIKILERKIHEEATRISKFHPHTPDDNKKKNEFVPDMDGLHKRFSDIEGYIDSLRKTMKNIDQRLKKEITLLNDNKSDKQEQKEVEKELTAMKIKLDKLDLQVHQNKENIEWKLNSIEREVIPLIDDKLKLHAEMLHISTTRIENIEIKIEQLNKIVNKNNKEDFDISIIQKFDEKLRKFGNQINIIQDDFELTIKEIRNILYTKADDESLTDLENKILLKLNELVENICK